MTPCWWESVLSGLSPQTVLDVLSRSIGFWCYQATQEMLFNFSLDLTAAHITNIMASLFTRNYTQWTINLKPWFGIPMLKSLVSIHRKSISNIRLTQCSSSSQEWSRIGEETEQRTCRSSPRENKAMCQNSSTFFPSCCWIQSLYDKMKRKVIINPLQSLDMQNVSAFVTFAIGQLISW